MIIGKKPQVATDFKPSINHNLIKQTNNLQYLGVYLDNKLSWKSHIDILITKLSKICGIIYKLRHYVPLFTLKSIYFSLFHSQLQYSFKKSYDLPLNLLQYRKENSAEYIYS